MGNTLKSNRQEKLRDVQFFFVYLLTSSLVYKYIYLL